MISYRELGFVGDWDRWFTPTDNTHWLAFVSAGWVSMVVPGDISRRMDLADWIEAYAETAVLEYREQAVLV